MPPGPAPNVGRNPSPDSSPGFPRACPHAGPPSIATMKPAAKDTADPNPTETREWLDARHRRMLDAYAFTEAWERQHKA